MCVNELRKRRTEAMAHLYGGFFLEASLTFLIFSQLDLTKGELSNNVHRTQAATHLKHDLLCYECDTMEDGDKCLHLGGPNKTALLKKCHTEKRVCMVKRYSYTTSTENSTSVQRLWSLQRLCSPRCESGCIVIGERTKLYACTACCSVSGCNDGRGEAPKAQLQSLVLYTLLCIHFALR